MGKQPNKNTAIAAAMAKASGPQRPEYVPQDIWEVMDADQQKFASNPTNEAAVKAVYAPEETDTAIPEQQEAGERVEMAMSEDYIPTSFDNLTFDLAAKITEQDREQFVEAVETEMIAKVRTVALVTVIKRAYGNDAEALPRFGTTAKTSNNPDLFEYKKKTAKGVFAKKVSDGSVLEITAYKAMIPLGMHNEIRKIEKDIAGLGKGAQAPVAWTTRLDELRERRNKLVKKFIFAVRLVHKLADIGEMKKVGWEFISTDGDAEVKDDMSNLTPATACVLLFSKREDGSKGGKFVALSPNVILDYRVEVANAKQEDGAGTFDDLLASTEAGTPEQSEGEAEIEIPTFAEGIRVLRGFYKWETKFVGPNATKADAKSFHGYLMSDAGSELLSLIFSVVEELEEGVTSKPDLRSKNTSNKTRLQRVMGGDANRQLKDQQDGATQKVA